MYTKEEIIELIAQNDVKFIRLQFTDILGHLKNVSIMSSQLRKALDDHCMFDGSSIEGFVRIEESDMYLHPDLNTFMIYPDNAKYGRVARLICDVYKPDGTPFEGDPRYILRRTIAQAAELGFTFEVGPELEFFMFNLDEYGHPTTETYDTSRYFDLAPDDLGEDTRRDICLALEKVGFEIEASHHECATAQHEIDFKYAEALTAADRMMTFKMLVKSVAATHGLYATFMPKPIEKEAGSGMHINMSLQKDGRNAFFDASAKDGLSETALHFIAGIMEHIPGICAIANPIVNSYKRLVPGYEAPCYVAWTSGNRSTLIRVPVSRGAGTRVELRSPDPAGNPYLVLAILLSAGLDGIRRKLLPPAPVGQNVYEMTPAERKASGIADLPGSLQDAIAALKADSYLCETIGPHIFEKYTQAKEDEWNRYAKTVTKWEIAEYLGEF